MTAPLLNADQAAELLNVSKWWVRQEARANRIPHVRLGRNVRFDGEALEELVAGTATGPRALGLPWGYTRKCGSAARQRPDPWPTGDLTPMSSINPTRGRRSYGTGTLYTRADRHGRETYYGIGYQNGRRFNRKLGVKRTPGTRDGLTRTQAETKLAKLIGATNTTTPAVGEQLTMAQVGERYRAHAQRRGRKPSTVGNLESELRVHLVPYFTDKPISSITTRDVADFVATLEGKGLAPKTIRNVVGNLSALVQLRQVPATPMAARQPLRRRGAPRPPPTAARSGS